MTKLYTSQKIYGANIFYPERLTITDNSVIYELSKGGFGLIREKTIIPRKYINRIRIFRNLLGSHVEIFFFGANAVDTQSIIARNFHHEDVEEIDNLLIIR